MSDLICRVIQVTCDADGSLVWWPAKAALTYESGEWFDMNCKYRGDPVSLELKVFFMEALNLRIAAGERKLVELKTI